MFIKKPKWNKVILLFFLIIATVFAGLSSAHFVNTQTYVDTSIFNENLRISATYNTTLSINDMPSSLYNWTWAKNQGYCTGAGILSNPYVIQNHIFNVSLNTCIEIFNSRKYFIIRNCDLTTNGISPGILLQNTTNGVLRDNVISNCFYGIELVSSNENSILFNTIEDCSDGIYLHISSVFNTISYNIVNHNSDDGIYIAGTCHNNTISYNIVKNNLDEGIYSPNSDDMTFSYNTVYNNTGFGIYLTGVLDSVISSNIVSYQRESGIIINNGDNCIIENNYVHHNGIHGIYLTSGCQNNIIKSNKANYNNNSGFFLYNSNDNLITKNEANFNKDHGILLYLCDNHVISDNVINNNEIYGVYLLGSNDNVISYNLANFNNHGVYLDTSNNNFILYNNLASNIVCYNETGSTGNIFEGNICIAVAPPMDRFILGLIIGLITAGGAFGSALATTLFLRKRERKK
ncbi:MAG: NosD domain-containing protein [Promethearchaeota archaeon]